MMSPDEAAKVVVECLVAFAKVLAVVGYDQKQIHTAWKEVLVNEFKIDSNTPMEFAEKVDLIEYTKETLEEDLMDALADKTSKMLIEKTIEGDMK